MAMATIAVVFSITVQKKEKTVERKSKILVKGHPKNLVKIGYV